MTDDEETTTSTRTRWAYTNDIAAIAIVAATYSLRAVTVVWGIEPPSQLLWATDAILPILAGAWLFGTRAVDAVTKLRS